MMAGGPGCGGRRGRGLKEWVARVWMARGPVGIIAVILCRFDVVLLFRINFVDNLQ